MADDENFSTDVRTCTTALTSYTLFPGGTLTTSASASRRRRQLVARAAPRLVRATRAAVVGLYSDGQAFTWSAPVVDVAPGDTPFAPVTGTAIGVSAYRIDQDGGCTDTFCGDVPATPVFDWDVQQYAKFYRVLVSEDADFTNIAQNVVTNESRLALTAPLRESSAGGSYYWYVIPCRGGTLASPSTCGPSPQSVSDLPGVKQFRKVSPAITGLASSDPAGTDITFSWQDYFTTNQATPGWAGRDGQPVGPHLPHPGRHRAVVLRTAPRRGRGGPDDVHRAHRALPRGHALLAGPGPRQRAIGLPWSGTGPADQVQPGGRADLARQRRGRGGHGALHLGAAGVRLVVHGRGLQEQRRGVLDRSTGCSPRR